MTGQKPTTGWRGPVRGARPGAARPDSPGRPHDSRGGSWPPKKTGNTPRGFPLRTVGAGNWAFPRTTRDGVSHEAASEGPGGGGGGSGGERGGLGPPAPPGV